jgi:HlyD family secretion protein
MRKTILVVVILALVGGGWYAYTEYNKKEEPATITTAKITRGDVAEMVGATGTLQAVTTVQVGSQVSGIVKSLEGVDFNSIVHKGQVIARLDPSLFQTQIDQAKANLIRSQADLQRLKVSANDATTKLARAKELYAKKLISQADLEAAQLTVTSNESQVISQNAAVTQSEASLQQAIVNMEHTVIEAPIDGLVISRNVDVGQTVAASMSAPTLFILAADLTKMQVVASLDESDVGRIRPGQNVTFRVDAYPADVFTGSVAQVRLQPTTVQNVVTYSTVIDVPNPELKLKPGMTANVNVEIEMKHDVLRVPNAALRFRPSTEVFTALGQTPPPAPARGGRGGRGGAGSNPGGSTSMTPGAPASSTGVASAQANPAPRPTAQAAAQGADPAARRGRQSTDQAAAGGGRGGQGAGQGGGRGGNMQERMATMTPEERTAFLERMRERGIDPNAPGGGRGGNGAGGRGGNFAGGRGGNFTGGQGGNAFAAGGGQRAGRTPAAQAPVAAAASSGATTIDALFGPLPITETTGQVWTFKKGAAEGKGTLTRVQLRLGVSDGQNTALVAVLGGGDLKEDDEVVTNVITAAQRAASMAAGSAAPIFGQQQRGGGGQFPGQGGGPIGGGGGGGARGGGGGGGGRGR